MKKFASILLPAVVTLTLATEFASARDLTVVNWGGAPAALQHDIYFKPFTEKTGIPVVEDSWQGGYGTLKAKAEGGQVDWDVVQVESDELALGCADGIYEPIDWSLIGDRQTFFPQTASECGVGSVVYSFALAYDGNRIKDGPASWADFWDVKKFPGKRAMRKGAKSTLELALLADGVPSDQLYPVLRTAAGVDRAFAKLQALKSDIVWYESTSQVVQLLTSGEVAMAVAPDGLMLRLNRDEKRNLKVVWQAGSLSAIDSLVIMKGTPFQKEAMQLVAFMSKPENLAAYAERLPTGIPNTKAMSLVPEATAKLLLSDPKNYAKATPVDKDFWLDNGEELTRRFNAWLAQ